MKSLSPSQLFVFYRTYSRWQDGLQRRETWEEAVERYFAFFKKKFESKVPKKVWQKTQEAVLSMDVMPSMRALWSAGPALEKNNIIGYNCGALAFQDLVSPSELFYILMCSTGCSFAIEKQFIDQIPAVKPFTEFSVGTHVVGDSREGWATSLRVGVETWFDGKDVEFDYSNVRRRGARLKTMGGRASGPEPLMRLHQFTRDIILKAQGRRLYSDEWLDIGNMCGLVTEVGGIRRAAESTFSDLDDERMRHAKDFPIPEQRRQSNNSAVYVGKPDMITFMREWTALAASGSGERGIFNLAAAKKSSPRREESEYFRANPCFEIILRVDTGEFCNLTENVIRAHDTFATLQEKVKSSVWLGVMQACLTDFPFIRPSFKEMCEKERLLGVSLTGLMDNPKLITEERLEDLRDVAIRECRKACKALGINMSAAITTGKPSGSVSQLVNCASGGHTRYAKFYIRRYRISATDPLYRMMKDQGVKFVPELNQGPGSRPDWKPEDVMTWVVEFPEAAPAKALTRHDVTAVEQLEWYLKLKKHWCEHNQSMTVYVKETEWLQVASWVYDHFDDISGVSFLPFDGGKYELAPYQEITKAEYEEIVKRFPIIDYSKLSNYENDDNTTGSSALACTGDACELK